MISIKKIKRGNGKSLIIIVNGGSNGEVICKWRIFDCQVSHFQRVSKNKLHLSSVQRPCWLMISEDDTIQYIGDYHYELYTGILLLVCEPTAAHV